MLLTRPPGSQVPRALERVGRGGGAETSLAHRCRFGHMSPGGASMLGRSAHLHTAFEGKGNHRDIFTFSGL